MKKVFLYCLATAFSTGTYAQTYNRVSSTEGNLWQQSKVKLQPSAAQTPF
jgi:glucosylceramidase